ncbi:MAG: cyanophycin synthetase, partial [Candidatus Margulisbacteria bacterium]|nr:cyanophycin synthetase [Candidatus Margulisiibacteriota bacterium]
IAGLKKVKWPGRFQVISKKPLTILDGAHNPAGARVLAETLRSQFPGRKFTFVLGVQKDKDAAAMVGEIKNIADDIIITHSANRAAADSVAGRPAIGLSKALKSSTGKDRVITGSLYLVADALKYLDVGMAP